MPNKEEIILVGPVLTPQTGPKGAQTFLWGIYPSRFWTHFGHFWPFSAAY